MFCIKCGKEIHDGIKFCNYCGAQLQAKNQQVVTETSVPKAKKTSKMKITGIVLVCLQIFGFLAKPFDEYAEFFNSGAAGYCELFGYCIIGIIGIILIIKGIQKEKQ